MKIQILLLFVFISILSFSKDNQRILVIDDNLKSINLNQYTYLYSTLDTSSSVNTILNKTFSSKPKDLTIGLNDKIWWEKITFNNPSKKVKEFYIYFPYNHINKIITYQRYQKQINRLTPVGTFFKSGDLGSYGRPIHIYLKPGINTVFIYISHMYLPLRASSYLLTKTELKHTDIRNRHIIGFWQGFFVLAILLTLTLFIATKIKLFLYYFLLNIGVGLFFISEIGDISRLLISDPYNLTIDIKHLGNLMVLFFFPLLINEFTPISKSNYKMWKWIFYIIYPMVIFWAICLIPSVKQTYFLYFSTYYIIVITAIIFPAQLYFIFRAFLQKRRNSLALLFAYSLYVVLVFSSVLLPNLGVVKNNIQVYNSLIFGSIIEIIMFMALIGKETFAIYKQRSDLLEEQKNHQTEIIKAIVESQEKERNIVGRELHDMIGANISVIKQHVNKNNTTLMNIINKTIDSIRNLSHGLITPIIENDGFIDEINELCVLFSSIDINIKSNFHNWLQIENTEKITHLYRIIQELLQNAVKHSKATNVLLQFIINPKGELTVMYEDNGIGFDYKSSYPNKGLGLINIENRIKLIDGSIIYDTKKGRTGTTIIINVPNLS